MAVRVYRRRAYAVAWASRIANLPRLPLAPPGRTLDRVSGTPPPRRDAAPEGVEGLYEPSADRAGYVRRIFGEIAGRYDLMNTIMTGGRHHAWRAATARALVRPGDRVVDAGCGTGDLSLACARAGAGAVIGVDFAAPMLPLARRKAARRGADGGGGRVGFVQGDGLRLPLADGSADAWCAAFVLRNVPDVDGLLAEARRVLRPGGRLAVLDIPRIEGGMLAPLQRFHLARVVPLLGRLFGGHADAYRYLPVSAERFMSIDELSSRLAASGFEVERVRTFGVGTVALHLAVRTPLSPLPSDPSLPSGPLSPCGRGRGVRGSRAQRGPAARHARRGLV